MNLYFVENQNLVDSQGAKFTNEIFLGYNRLPTWYINFVTADAQTATVTAVDVSDAVTWKAAVDKDFSTETEPMCRTLNANIDSSRADEGIIGVVIDSFTATFLAAVGTKARLSPVYFQLEGYNGDGNVIHSALFQIVAQNSVDPSGGDPPDPPGNYYTITQIDLLLADKIDEDLTGYDAKTTPAGTELVFIDDSGTGKYMSIANLCSYLGSPLDPQGNWDADTNDPDISGTTTTGHFWIVSVAGTTDLGGITDWAVNDWAVKTATGWAKVDNSDTNKADKVTGAVSGNFAGLDSNGNLTDSGSKAADFATTSHTQAASTITDFDTEVSNNTDVAANTTDRHTHSNKAQLDLVTDGDHDVRTDNPHSVTYTQAGAEPANANIQSHVSSTSNPHSVTKTQVSLANVTDDAQIKKSASSTSGNVPTWNGTTGDALDGTGLATGDASGSIVLRSDTNTVSADVVSEITADTGVTIDGLKIKDAGLVLTSDADGDIYYRYSGILARLGIGTAYQKLQVNSGGTAPEWTSDKLLTNTTVYVGTSGKTTVFPSAVSNEGGGLVGFAVTSHSFSTGDSVKVTGTTHYNGDYTVDADSTSTKIVVTAAYSAEGLTEAAIYYNQTATAAEIQAVINAFPKDLSEYIATVQFYDGAYTIASVINIQAFKGKRIRLLGNAGTTDGNLASVLFLTSVSYPFGFYYNSSQCYFQYFKIIGSAASYNCGAYFSIGSYFFVSYVCVVGTSVLVGAGDMGIFAEDMNGTVRNCKFNNTYMGIRNRRAYGIVSNTNVEIGTSPAYGLYADGGVITKIGTQPAGSTANEYEVNGGDIR